MQQDDNQIPQLLLISKKKQEQTNIISHESDSPKRQKQKNTPKEIKQKSQLQNSNRKQNKGDKNKPQKQISVKEPLNQNRVKDIEKKVKDLQPSQKKKQKLQQNIERDNEKATSQLLIRQMLDKIKVKNISQELYPVTDETIVDLVNEFNNEINELELEVSKKQNSLEANPDNKNLIKQLNTIKKSINYCHTIKSLYQEKINFRNKITVLQNRIIELKVENRNLLIKVSNGNDRIQKHMHNLPCQKEKQLLEKLEESRIEFQKQKKMRENLQNNVKTNVLNFRKLYDQAELARLIVTKKLKEIEEREKKCKNVKQQQQVLSSGLNSSSIVNRSPLHQSSIEEKKTPKYKTPVLNLPQKNIEGQITTISKKGSYARMKAKQDVQIKEEKKITLEQKVQRMRANQSTLSRMYNPK